MSTRRKKYDADFRAESVRLVLSSDRPVKESTLGNWLHRHRERQPNATVPPEDRGPVAWDEHQKALAENERLRAEVEFLGKVSAFFAAKQK